MKLNVQKRIAASVLNCSPKRVIFDNSRLSQIKEAITKADMRGLVIDSIVWKIPKRGISNSRTNSIRIQKTKGKRKGHGSRKGRKFARTPRKREWINRIRLQRELIGILKEKKLIDNKIYWMLYAKCKGGFFRSRRHLKLYIEEQGLIGKSEKKAEKPEEKKTLKKPKENIKVKK